MNISTGPSIGTNHLPLGQKLTNREHFSIHQYNSFFLTAGKELSFHKTQPLQDDLNLGSIVAMGTKVAIVAY